MFGDFCLVIYFVFNDDSDLVPCVSPESRLGEETLEQVGARVVGEEAPLSVYLRGRRRCLSSRL